MTVHTVYKLLMPALFCCVASAQDFSPSQPPFTASLQALQHAFSNLQVETNPVTILLEEGRFEYDSEGRQTFRYRMIFKIWSKSAVENWSIIERTWAPWEEKRPSIKARVIAADSTIHELDEKTIADAPARERNDDVLTDRRMVRAALPAVEVNSIVEEEIVTTQTVVPLNAGNTASFRFGASVPVQRTLLHVELPVKLPFRYKTRLLPNLATSDTTEGGVRHIAFDQGPMAPLKDTPFFLPPDEPRTPFVAFSTAPGWSAVAKAYSDVVESQIAGFAASAHLPKFSRTAKREDKILAIVDFLHKEIRYTGIEFSESSLVPHKPAEVLAHKYGDCKDKASLAVALLRGAGIEANVALLDSSTGADIEPELPGLGVFNHAIVYVGGQPGLWLDPTDTDLTLHVISPENQGRFALIARPETTDLVRTPELTAEDNRVLERRQFDLAEFGRAHVIETSETFGTPDRSYRSQFGGQNEKDLRKSFKDYIEWTYADAKTQAITVGDASDLGKPFRLTIELNDAQRGTTARTEAAVGIRVAQLTTRLPEFFRTEPPKQEEPAKSNPEPAAPPRTADFAITEPYTYEWHYVIKAPPGFKVRQLPESMEEKLGIATLAAHFSAETPTSVLADFRFVMPKRRFSAPEGLALRDAMLALGKRKMTVIYFDQIGETALASGKVKEAIVEFAALRKLHPTEALHAMQTARAMLAAGAGTTARAEARRAVELEPASQKAYIQLAEVLKSDLVGRPMAKGYDRDGTAAAYRKALELDPNDNETRANLAILLEYDEAGVRYTPGARLDEAIATYTPIVDKLTKLGLPSNYAVALLRGGRTKDLKEYLRGQPESENNQMLQVCADALLTGAKAGIERAGEVSGVESRRRVLAGAAQTLIVMRRYDLAAELMTAVAAGADNPAAVTNLVDVLRKARHFDEAQQDIHRPEDAVMALAVRVLLPAKYKNTWLDLFSPLMLEGEDMDDTKALASVLGDSKAQLRASGMSIETALDIGLTAAQYSKEGDDVSGWVVRQVTPGNGTTMSGQQVCYVVQEGDTYRILATNGAFAGVARLVLRLLEQGKSEQARVWLDRVRQEVPAGSGDDPLSGSMFSRFWQQGQLADSATLRAAAALLLSDNRHDVDKVIPILESAAGSSAPGVQDAITASLAEAYHTAKRYDRALSLSERLLTKLPQSASALSLTLKAAYAAGGNKEAGRITETYLSRFKTNPAALRSAASIAMAFGDTERSISLERQLIDSGRGQPSDYNNLVWAAIMAGRLDSGTIEIANRGMMISNNTSPGILHTIAAMQAELDKPADARATLLKRIAQLGEDEPDDNDWYVFGRIAESYGLGNEAAAMYRRVERPRDDYGIAATSYTLAQRHLKSRALTQ
jgi:tetratricopeptide (TPR) repeat protein/transglutaminase-like putative cysteine protease